MRLLPALLLFASCAGAQANSYSNAAFSSSSDQDIRTALVRLETLEEGITSNSKDSYEAVKEAKGIIRELWKRDSERVATHMLWKLSEMPERSEWHEIYMLEFIARAQVSDRVIRIRTGTPVLRLGLVEIGPEIRRQWTGILIQKALAVFDKGGDPDFLHMYGTLTSEFLQMLDWDTEERPGQVSDESVDFNGATVRVLNWYRDRLLR